LTKLWQFWFGQNIFGFWLHFPEWAVLEKRHVNPETSEFSSAGTYKKYRCTVYSGDASRRKIMKNMTYRVLDPGFTMHA
jgi:hypothetical protein